MNTTNIADVVLDADGTPAIGQVTVHWPQYMVNGTAVTQGQRTYEITDGNLNLNLYPTISAQPTGSYYTATFELDNGATYDEYWVVPNLPTVKLNQVRAMFPPAPGLFINSLQITGGGAQNGQFLGWNGTQWVPTYVTTLNVSPNNIVFGLSSGSPTDADLTVTGTEGVASTHATATLGGQLTLNVPDASPSARGVVTVGAQTFGGVKTFGSQVIFNNDIFLPGFVPSSPAWGEMWFDPAQNIFHLQGSLQLEGAGENLGMLLIHQIAVNHLDLTGAGLSNIVTIPSLVSLPGQESILLPGSSFAHGIGVDRNDWLWLGSGSAFASLRPDAAWVSNWIDLSPYQHPIAYGAEAAPAQASIVLYRDATQWIGMGVDTAMRIWFRIGPNGAGQYYYLAPDGGSLGVYTWVNHALVAQRAGINLIPGQYVTMGAVDNPANNTVDVTINALGNLVDPLTTRGDLIVRGQILPGRFPAVYDGTYRVLTCDPNGLHGLSWTIGVPTTRRIIAGAGLWGGGDLSQDVDIWANVLSVFGRTGNIVMTAADIINAGGMVDPTIVRGDLIVRGPYSTVNKGTTRLGPGIDGSVLVCDSAQPLGVYWVPGAEFGAQTPWLQNIDGANYNLTNVGNLQVNGDTILDGTLAVGLDSILTGNLAVGGDTVLTGTLAVGGDSVLTGDLSVSGDSALTGDLDVGGNLTVDGTSTLTGDVALGADFSVTGDTVLQGALTVAGDTTLQSDLAVTGDSTLTGTLSVTGDSDFANIAVTGTSGFTGDMTVTGDLALTGDTALNGALEVTGDSQLLGSLDIGANLDVGGVLTTVGDATIGGDLTVTGDFHTGGTLINGNLTATGDSDLQGDVVIGGGLEVATIDSGSTTPVVFTPPLEAGSIDLNPDIQTWGNVQAALEAMDNSIQTLSRGMSYVGSYDAANDIATFVPSLSALDGPLPPADSTGLEQGDFLIATSSSATIDMGDQLISGGSTGGPNWDILNVGHVSMTASMVAVTAAAGIPAGWTTVQAALADIANGAAQTPWLSNINANGWALCSGSTTNALVFSTGAPAAATERMRITATGVGIGMTPNAAYLLDVAGDARFDNNLTVLNDALIGGNAQINNMLFTPSGFDLRFGSQSTTERMRITAAGNVGIGNTAVTLPIPSGYTFLAVGPSAVSSYGFLVACGNQSTLSQPVGSLAFANYAITAADKRIAEIHAITDGATNSGAIRFYTWNAGAGAERMRLTSAGWLGIGTIPQAPLHVHTAGTVAASAFVPVTILARMPGDLNFQLMTFNGSNVNVSGNEAARFGLYYNSTSEWNSGIRWLRGGARIDGSMLFDTFGLERMRITDAGNVGVGTDAAVLPQSSTPLRFLIVGSSTSATNYGVVAIVGNTASLDAAVGDLSWANYNITATEKRLAVITGRTSGAVNSGALVFYTANAGTLSAERMRITPLGLVGIGNAVATLPFATAASYPQLIVGPTTATGFHGFLVTCGNVTALANPVGAYAFANYAITATEKRIAEIHAATDGAINSGCLRFYTWNAGTSVQRMRITALGHVSVGSDGAPPFGGAYNILMVGPQTTGGGAVKGVVTTCANVTTAATELGFIAFANFALTTANKACAIISGTTGAQTNSGRLLFYTYNSGTELERMRILETGELCIGTTTVGAGATLDVNGNVIFGPSSYSSHGWVRIRAGNAAGNEAYLSFVKSVPAASAQEWQCGLVDATGNFLLWGHSTTNPSMTAMTVLPSGRVGIGVTNPGYLLQLSVDSAAKPGTNTWTIVSDIRTKRDVQPFDGGIETIRRLEPIVAEYNGMAHMPEGQRVVSLDPAKLRSVVPHAVTSVRGKLKEGDVEETEILGVNTHEIFYHLLKAVQQLDREVRELKGERKNG